MKLIRANINDCEKIWKMQKEAFADLLEKYQDYQTSPANELVEKIKAKLLEIKEREHLEKIEDIKGVQKEIAWGSQIRSYVFMPYTLAKDHRTGFEMGNIDAVMDGDIDGFINAYLKALSLGEIK